MVLWALGLINGRISIGVPSHTVPNRRQNDMPQSFLPNGGKDSCRKQQSCVPLSGLEWQAAFLGSLQRVLPVSTSDGTGQRFRLIKSLSSFHGCTSGSAFCWPLCRRLLASISSKVTGSKRLTSTPAFSIRSFA